VSPIQPTARAPTTEQVLTINGAPDGLDMTVANANQADRALRSLLLASEEYERCVRAAYKAFNEGASTLRLTTAPKSPALSRLQRDTIVHLLSEARDAVYRASDELDGSDPHHQPLRALAAELDALKVVLGRRCGSCS